MISASEAALQAEHRLDQGGGLERAADPERREQPGPDLPGDVGGDAGEQSRDHRRPVEHRHQRCRCGYVARHHSFPFPATTSTGNEGRLPCRRAQGDVTAATAHVAMMRRDRASGRSSAPPSFGLRWAMVAIDHHRDAMAPDAAEPLDHDPPRGDRAPAQREPTRVLRLELLINERSIGTRVGRGYHGRDDRARFHGLVGGFSVRSAAGSRRLGRGV